jgi:hypothetical protein
MHKTSNIIKTVVLFAVILSLLFQICRVLPVYADSDYTEVTYSLNSNEVDDTSITLYIHDSVPFVSIKDLCSLTRCEYFENGNIVEVSQGLYATEFDIAAQTFDDGFDVSNINIIETDNGYAVPALAFLNYFKAAAFIENDTLYCRMPPCTAWEAISLDFDNTLVDIYELYGGGAGLTGAMIADIIVDYIMGDMSTSDGYLNDAFLSALKVDITQYDAVKDYAENVQKVLYDDINSDTGAKMVEALGTVLGLSSEPTEWYIQYYYNMLGDSFSELAFNALKKGNISDAQHYSQKMYEAFTDKNRVGEKAGKYFTNAGYLMMFVSVAAETAQQMKYIEATDDLVYNVMGEENLEYLKLDVGDNDWFKVANSFKDVLGVTSSQLETAAKEYLTNDVTWDGIIGALISSYTDISGGTWSFALSLSRMFTENFPYTKSLVEAFRADLNAIYLSELQQNVYSIISNIFLRIQENPDDPELYKKLVQAEELYCRTSIAMYEGLITSAGEFSNDPEYWTDIFQSRIDYLAVSLYRLTGVQDDGIDGFFPVDIESFDSYGAQKPKPYDDNYKSRYKVFDLNMTWEEAKDYCEELGGHLAVITSPEEQELVYPLIADGEYEGYWLGASVYDGEWGWITGEDFDYTNWEPWEPNESEDDMHMQMYRDDGCWDDTWNDGDHGSGIQDHGFICEFEDVPASF